MSAAALLVAAVYVAAARSGGHPERTAALIGTLVAAAVAARVISSASRALVPALVVVAAAVVAVSSRRDLFSSYALSGSFGYANAKSAFFALAAVASLLLVVLTRRAWTRAAGSIAAACAAAVPLASRTVAVASLLPAAIGALAVKGATAVRVFVAGCALFLLTVIVSTFLMATWRPADRGPVGRLAAKALSERRLVLWHEAWLIALHHPASGVGPGRFQVVSPTARSDRDSRWAHNEFLQTAAETGVPGLLGLLGVFAWGFARLFGGAAPGRATPLAALALTVLGVEASVDYVLHFPAVPVLAVVLVASVTARDRTPEPAAFAAHAGADR